MFPQPTKATRSRRGDGDMLGEGSGGIAGVGIAVVSVFPHTPTQQVKTSQVNSASREQYRTYWLKNTGGSLVAVKVGSITGGVEA